MATIYGDYSRDKIGWFFGLSGWQLATLATTVLPVFWSIQHGAWRTAAAFAALWAFVFVLTVVPVRGRSATGWLAASTGFAIGALAGWTRFASRASTGTAADLGQADLPGVLQGIQIHDGPPQGPALARVGPEPFGRQGFQCCSRSHRIQVRLVHDRSKPPHITRHSRCRQLVHNSSAPSAKMPTGPP